MNNSAKSRGYSPAFDRKIKQALLQKQRRKEEARPYRIQGEQK